MPKSVSYLVVDKGVDAVHEKLPTEGLYFACVPLISQVPTS